MPRKKKIDAPWTYIDISNHDLAPRSFPEPAMPPEIELKRINRLRLSEYKVLDNIREADCIVYMLQGGNNTPLCMCDFADENSFMEKCRFAPIPNWNLYPYGGWWGAACRIGGLKEPDGTK